MINQKDIARMTGLSPSLISRVLSGQAEKIGLAAETVEKVLKIARENNYMPSQFAMGLKKGQTNLIGVIINSFDDLFLMTILNKVKNLAAKQGLSLLLTGFESGEYNEKEVTLLQRYLPESYLIIGSSDFSNWNADFFKSNKRIVQIGQNYGKRKVISCSTNEAEAAQLILNKLSEMKLTNFVCSCDGTKSNQVRLNLFLKEASARGVKVSNKNVYQTEAIGANAGIENTKRLLESNRPLPDLIFALDDYVAMGVMRELSCRNISVPSQMKVIGFDDIPLSSITFPTLTTVQQPIDQIIEKALELLLREDIQSNEIKKYDFSPSLMERESS